MSNTPTMSKSLKRTAFKPASREQLAAAYREIRLAFSYDISGITPDRFNAACLAIIGDNKPTAEAYVAAAKCVRFGCRRCAGTGRFITYVENGVPKGPGGECFRCSGKGEQTLKDAQRNEYHDMHQTVRM
jgi:hypothetical protein